MHGHSGGVLPGPIPNPEVKPSCVDSCTVAREPTGTFVAVPLSFTPRTNNEITGRAIVQDIQVEPCRLLLETYSATPMSESTCP